MKVKVYKLVLEKQFLAVGPNNTWWTIAYNVGYLAQSVHKRTQEDAANRELHVGSVDVEFPRSPCASIFLGGRPAHLKTPLSDQEIETFYNCLKHEFSRHGDSC